MTRPPQRSRYLLALLYLLSTLAAFALPACRGSALSPASITAQQLLDRYEQQTVLRFGPGVYHFRYKTVTSDGEITFSDYYSASGPEERVAFRTSSVYAGSRVSLGRAAGQLWQQSANGLVLPDAKRGTVFDRVLREAIHRPDPRVRILGITQDVPQLYVLEIRPNAHIVERRFFETKTFLPRKTETTDYEGRVRTRIYNDYVEVGATRLPSRTVAFDNISKQTSETLLLSVERLPSNAALLAKPRSRRPFVPQNRLPAALNTIFGRRGILVRVDINGAPFWFKFDSGASNIVLDRSFARELGLKEFWRYTDSKGGRYDSALAVLPRMDVGPLYATNIAVGVVPLAEREEGVDVVGLLGCDFIASMPLAIDFGKQIVAVLPNGAFPKVGWTSVHAPLQHCTPTIGMTLNGYHAALVLDFGADETILNEDVLEKIDDNVTQLDTTPISYIGRSPLLAVQYAIPHAWAGSINLSPIVATVVKGGRGQDLDDDGILGRNVLSGFQIVLDYSGQRVFFRKDSIGRAASSDR